MQNSDFYLQKYRVESCTLFWWKLSETEAYVVLNKFGEALNFYNNAYL